MTESISQILVAVAAEDVVGVHHFGGQRTSFWPGTLPLGGPFDLTTCRSWCPEDIVPGVD